MKKIILSLILSPFLTGFAQANTALLEEPELNQCNSIKGITKCEVVCKRSLGEQCLITHVNFEGTNLKTDDQLLRAKFQTCKNANMDFQISSLAVELEKLDQRKSSAKITAEVNSSGKQISLRDHSPIEFNASRIDGRLGRTYFNEFISSGSSFVETTINLKQCGHEDKTNSCTVYGQLVAVTDPNIRCDFHDNTKPGAYRDPDKIILPTLHNSVKPVGRIVQ